MTWLWIALFALGCTTLMGGYVYLVEIRGGATSDITLDGSDDTQTQAEVDATVLNR